MKTVAFLHIPKTAGQAIHHELVRVIGKDNVSPIRVHSEVPQGQTNLPPGYLLHSGHIDWTDLETLPEDRFAFTVLRDPLERIASFYFYLLKEAKTLSAAELATPQQTGKRVILSETADDYFFGGDKSWQAFVHDHYDNFYASYLATGMIRGRRRIAKLSEADRMAQALEGAARLSRIYHIDDLGALEQDIARELGARIHVTDNFVNTGPHKRHDRRWPKLVALFERDDSVARLEAYAAEDYALMARLGLG
jgi:hypothetical protein